MWHKYTLLELAEQLERKEVSSVEITQHYLDRIARINPQVNALITIAAQEALAQAHAADQRRLRGMATKLTGLPIVHKDNFCTQGVRTTAGSKMLQNFVAPYDATVVKRLKDAGMVMLGKANMDEFAMGSSNETSYFGPVRNPWDLNCVPGGSSGGSAAALAARMTPAATGSDTGGSIRQPAALCGLSGLKPSYGRLSRFGMVAYASSLDQAGPMAHTVADCALLFDAMKGLDAYDATTRAFPEAETAQYLNRPIKGLRIGVPKEFLAQLDSVVLEPLKASLALLEQMGAHIQEISLPNSHYSVPVYYVIAPAECSSNLSRFDGVRFGYRCDAPKDLEDLYRRSRTESLGPEVQRRILMGTYVLSSGQFDVFYNQAQKVRQLIVQDFNKAFAQVDVIAGPASPTPAFALGTKQEPVQMYLSDIYTINVNLAGLPALVFPIGFGQGLPIGLQLIGRFGEESRLLNVGHQYQLQTDWHQKMPSFIEP